MSEPVRSHSFPRGALLGAATLVGFALMAATAARVGGIGSPTLIPTATPTLSRELRFEDRPDGAVAIHDVREGRVVDVLPPGSNGFVRGVLRGLARERKRQEIGQQPPFRLTLWDDGRLSLQDQTTGRQIELQAFGPTNLAAFARLLPAGGKAP
jgi:putative photosynthetic complex assembly protein